MLTLVSMLLAAFVVAALVIWLYRLFFGVQNYESKAIAKKRSRSSMKLAAQQGYISLGRKSEKATRKVAFKPVKGKPVKGKPVKGKPVKGKPGLRVANGANKVPWGW